MSNKDANPRVSITPEEDTRLPILEAEIEREWCQHRSEYVKSLLRERVGGDSPRCASASDV